MKSLFLFILFNLTLISGFAQFTQNLRGKVIDHESKASLPGASIAVFYNGNSLGTIADKDGYFELFDIPIGKIDIQISYIGYQPFELTNLQLISGKEKVLTIELIEKVIKMEEIMVTALRNGETTNKMTNLSVRSFSIKETERYAGSLGDPSRMASNFAGVITANDNRNDIIIRGNSPQGLLWRLEGINVPNPNHFGALGSTGGAISILNNNVLTNSDFFTGAFPAEYGNAISGVFDLKMRNGNTKENEFLGQIGFNGFELGAEGPISKKNGWSYLVNYRYSVLDIMDQLGFNMANGAIPEYQDLTVKLHFPTKKLGEFNIFGISGDSFIDFDEERGNTLFTTANGVRTRNGSSMFVAGITHRVLPDQTSNIFTTFAVTQQNVETQIDTIFDDQSEKRFFGEFNSETKYSASTQYTKKYNSKNTLNTGILMEATNINYVDSVDGSAINSDLANQFVYQLNTQQGGLNIWQAHAEWKHRINNYITLYGGLHFQQFMLNGTASIDPRFNFTYHLKNNTELSFAYGKHAKVQPFYVYFTESYDEGSDTYSQKNQNLELTQAHHFVFGYNHRIMTNLDFKSEIYYQKLYNVPVSVNYPYYSLVNAGNSFHQARVDELINEGTGDNYGIDLTLEKYLNKNYYYLLTTSLFDSKYKGYDKVIRNTEFNTNFVVNALGGYEIEISDKLSFDVNVRLIWSGGKRMIDINLDESIAQGSTVYNFETAYQNRSSDYFRLDGRASIILNGKNISQEWAVDLSNITNRKNIYSTAYNNDSKSIEYVYQQAFFPMFLYRINF